MDGFTEGAEMKTPEQMASDYAKDNTVAKWEYDISKGSFLAGYQVGFEIGCMKGSMAMQSTLDDDYHLTPPIDHEKLAKLMTKKETK